jgi:zinc/manganese transport system substrate-binding protein
MPIGVDPHEFQASPDQVARVHRADLVVAFGLGLESGLADVLSVAVSDGANLLELGPHLDPLPLPEAEGGHGHEDEVDPHIWMDPVRMAAGVEVVVEALEEIEPAIDWRTQGVVYADRLLALDGKIRSILATVPLDDRELVTNHWTMGYFADRYGWEMLGTVIPGGSSLGAPSSAEMAALVALMEQREVRAIFTDIDGSDDLARAVADEVEDGVVVVPLHTGSLGAPGSDAGTLLGMLEANARSIADASTGSG